MQTTTRTPFQPQPIGGGEFAIIDTRDGVAVDYAADEWAAERRCAALLIEERNREIALALSEPELTADDITAAEAEAFALGEQLVGELSQIDRQWSAAIAERRAPELIATLRTAYDDTSARIRKLGFDIGPVGDGSYCLYDRETQRPLRAAPASVAAPASATSVAPTPTVSAETAALDAILYRRAEQAAQAAELARADGDRESEKIARNSVGAYTKARALLLGAGVEFAGRAYLITPSGDLLVRSATRAGQWHAVSRRPIGADGYSPICCGCEHGQRGGFGICLHVGIFEAVEELMDTEAEIAARAILAAA